MGYQLKIYTVNKQNFKDLASEFNIQICNWGIMLPLEHHQIVVSNEIPVSDHEIPFQVSKAFPGIQYVIDCILEPATDDEDIIYSLLELAAALAKNGLGVVENLQTGEILLPVGLRRILPYKSEERFSVIKLSWWFNHQELLKIDQLKIFLAQLERIMPEILPKRYGAFEPPKEKFESVDTFAKYIAQHIHEGLVWYPARPVDAVSLTIPEKLGKDKQGYRFGHFSVAIDTAILNMPGWKTALIRLYKNISEILNPFYGDIYILNNYIRSRIVSHADNLTDKHPTDSFCWNGFPRKYGVGMLVGEPLLEHVSFNVETEELHNNCKLLIKQENDAFAEITSEDVIIPKELYQPNNIIKSFLMGSSKQYPKLWPFAQQQQQIEIV